MEIFINGQSHDVDEGLDVLALLDRLHLTGRLAVEINHEVIPRSQFDTQQLHAGDRVEIVHAIGGG